jgi:hypothetical protein
MGFNAWEEGFASLKSYGILGGLLTARNNGSLYGSVDKQKAPAPRSPGAFLWFGFS